MSATESIDTVVIGAGHAGLAVSRLLTLTGRDHVVLDRGRVGQRWRTERWDSLHLLTPSWMTRLPGWYYSGPAPDSYMSVGRFIRHLEGYARSFDAPVLEATTVESLTAAPTVSGCRYRISTDRGTWTTRNVVVATGPHGIPHLPPGLRPGAHSAHGFRSVEVVASTQYRNPGQLPPGGVLVVGASASGVQIADELSRAGREVTLAVGRHSRMPRHYRGMDIFWWLQTTGRLARTIDEMPDPVAARREPSLQLLGSNDPERQALDLGTLQAHGVRLVGRLHELVGGTARFGTDLARSVATADTSMHRFLDVVDEYVERAGLAREVWAGTRPQPIEVHPGAERVNLATEHIGTVVLAAGYRPHHPWLRVPITHPDGSIRQQGGVTPAPGVYVVGQKFQHRRDSGFIDGARRDAALVVEHLVGDRFRTAPVTSEEPVR